MGKKKKKTLKEQNINMTYEQDIFSDEESLKSLLLSECSEEIKKYSEEANGVKTVYRGTSSKEDETLSAALNRAISNAHQSQRSVPTQGGGKPVTNQKPTVHSPVVKTTPKATNTSDTTKPVTTSQTKEPKQQSDKIQLTNWISVNNKPYRRFFISDFTKNQYVIPTTIEGLHELADSIKPEHMKNLIELTAYLASLCGHPHAIFTVEEFMEMMVRNKIERVDEDLFVFTIIPSIPDYILVYYLDPEIPKHWEEVFKKESFGMKETASIATAVMILANKHQIPDDTMMYAEYISTIYEDMRYRQDWIEKLLLENPSTVTGDGNQQIRIEPYEDVCSNFTVTIAGFYDLDPSEGYEDGYEASEEESEEEDIYEGEDVEEEAGVTNDNAPFQNESKQVASDGKEGNDQQPVAGSKPGVSDPRPSNKADESVQHGPYSETAERRTENGTAGGNPGSNGGQDLQKEKEKSWSGSKPIGTSLGEKLKGLQIGEEKETQEKEEDDDLVIKVTRS